MARDFAVGFYHSKPWVKTRNEYMTRPIETLKGICPPLMCERCFLEGRLRPAEIVHHKIHLNERNINDPNITLSFSNLMRVCRDCHAKEHSGDKFVSRVWFSPTGEVMER